MAEDNNRTEELQEHRKLLIEIGKTEQWQCDRALLSLSGGAIGISFAFIEKIVTLENANCIWLLLSSWGCWTLTIVFVILSLFFNLSAHKKTIDKIDKNQNTPLDPNWLNESYKHTTFFNRVSLITFIVGILLIGLFIIKNIGGTP